MTTPLVRPQVRSVVPESVVEGLIGDADQQISALEEQVALAAAAAADAEARLAELGLDERSSAWAAIQLKRFVVSLRADAERDAGAIVAEARAHARRLVEDAIADDAMAAVESQRAHDARFERPTPAARPVASPLPEVTDLTDVTDGDAIFRAITAESLGALDQSVPIGPDAAFWAAEPDRRRRFTRRAMATQGLALVLVLTAAFVRFV